MIGKIRIMSGALRAFTIGLTAFLTVVDLFATQAILPALTRAYGVTPAEMGFAVNATTVGMAAGGLAVALAWPQLQLMTVTPMAFETARGEHRGVVLEDGTKVMLDGVGNSPNKDVLIGKDGRPIPVEVSGCLFEIDGDTLWLNYTQAGSTTPGKTGYTYESARNLRMGTRPEDGR